jgi:hypothetical protein
VSVDPATGLVVSNADHVRVYDPITGALLHDVFPKCVVVSCGDQQTPAVLLDKDGTVKVAQTVNHPARGSAVRIDAYAESAASAAIRVDQPGLDGAWYVQTSSGQGFTIDHFPGVDVFFMVYVLVSGQHPVRSGPTVVGHVAGHGDAGRERGRPFPVRLAGCFRQRKVHRRPTTISTSTGLRCRAISAVRRTGPYRCRSCRPSAARFLGPPTADVHRVGTATLTFTSCDSATMAHVFDNSDVAHAFAGISRTARLTRINGCSAN